MPAPAKFRSAGAKPLSETSKSLRLDARPTVWPQPKTLGSSLSRSRENGGGLSSRPMSDEVKIESARMADANAIARMSRRLVESGLGWRWTPRAVALQIRDPDSIVVVAKRGDEPLGFGIMQYQFERDRAHLVLLAIEPDARRRGIGSDVVRWLEKIARVGGIATIALEVRAENRGARRFYAALGYHETDVIPGYYNDIVDAVLLARDLRVRKTDLELD